MPTQHVTNIGGLNLFLNPLIKQEGECLRAVNVDSFPYGAKTKRPGYATFLGTADGSAVNTLFTWTKNDGTTLFAYRASGSSLYYSLQGTGAWTLAGNGTITAGSHVGHAVLDNTLVVCDGAGSTRHTTNGTSFTNTTLAPVSVDLAQYQNRIYAAGTSSTLFYSTTNDATNWNTSGTSDSSSLQIPGAGKLLKIFKASDRLVSTKNSGLMYRWDGYSLIDTSTRLGPTSPYAVAEKEGYYFLPNRDGLFGYGGVKPELLSNSVQRFFYNALGSGIPGANFETMAGATHHYDYFLSMGTSITDDFTRATVANAVLKYDFQKNEFLEYNMGVFPTAWHSYKDASGVQQLIFGDGSGQCYTLGGTVTTDNGTPIGAILELFTHFGSPELDKQWRWLYLYFNPGCQAKVQVAIEDVFTLEHQKWHDVGDVSDGVVSFRFPSDQARGKFLFLKIYESSRNTRFTFYGYSVNAEVIQK